MLTSGTLVQNLSKLVTQLGDFLIQLRAIRHVRDQRRGEDILITEGKGGALLIDGPHTLCGVSIKGEQGAIEDGITADSVGENLKSFLLRLRVVCLEVNGEPRIHGSCLLAGSVSRGDTNPFSEIGIAAAVGFLGNGGQGVEGGSVNGVDGFNAFLNNENLDDRLKVIIRHSSGRDSKEPR